jgi:glycosyltransferase involved in cell wall biosynthesis
VSYVEGLFVPIFLQIMKESNFEFHVMQFSWATSEKVDGVRNYCKANNITYTHCPVSTLLPVIGKIITINRGRKLIREYVIKERIDIIMPRSFVPASMVLGLKGLRRKIRIVYDADGLPIEERVDFAGLKKGSVKYRLLKRTEKKILKISDGVITRSERAIEVLAGQHGINPDKFRIVINGRNASQFRIGSSGVHAEVRSELGLPTNTRLIVYCGSLGPQYGLEEMLHIARKTNEADASFYLLLLVTNPEFLKKSGLHCPSNVLLKSVPFVEVPRYLSASNVALAIREPSFSMTAVAPIKLGEYLLSGLPVVASGGIGDTESLLEDKNFAFILKDHSRNELDIAIRWISDIKDNDDLRSEARKFGEACFSLQASSKTYIDALTRIEK